MYLLIAITICIDYSVLSIFGRRHESPLWFGVKGDSICDRILRWPRYWSFIYHFVLKVSASDHSSDSEEVCRSLNIV